MRRFTRILVVGRGYSGTSAIAGALHHLHVPMTDDPKWHQHDYPFYEHRGFHETLPRNPWLHLPEVVEAFRVFAESKRDVPLWGLKSPIFCACYPQLVQCFPKDVDVAVVAVRRPDHEVIDSHMRKGRSELGAVEEATKRGRLFEEQLKILAPDETIQFSEVVWNSRRVVERLVALLERLGWYPDRGAFEAAADFLFEGSRKHREKKVP